MALTDAGQAAGTTKTRWSTETSEPVVLTPNGASGKGVRWSWAVARKGALTSGCRERSRSRSAGLGGNRDSSREVTRGRLVRSVSCPHSEMSVPRARGTMVRASDLEEVGAGTGHYAPRGFESQGAKGKKRTLEPWARALGLVWGSGVALGAPLTLTPTAAFAGLSCGCLAGPWAPGCRKPLRLVSLGVTPLLNQPPGLRP